MILRIFIFLWTSINYSTQALSKVDCDLHKIYCRIVELQPKVNRNYAMRASNILHRSAKHYRYDPMLSVAIAMQETSWIPKDSASGLDIGLMQFHLDTINDLGLDVDRIRYDLDYMLWQHSKLLARKMRVCRARGWAKGEEWSCWHIYPTNYEREITRQLYSSKVKRYLKEKIHENLK